MSITSRAEVYRTELLSQHSIELVLNSSPITHFTGPGVSDIPNSYSGLDYFLVQPPFVSTPGGLISDSRFMNEKDGIHTVKQKTVRINFKRISAAAEINHDDVKFLFNRDQFPSSVPTSLTSFLERGERTYQKLLMQVVRQINDHQFKTIASRAFICAGSTEDNMYDCIEGYMRQLIDYMIRVNGGVLRTSRLVGSMPNSAIGVLRTKSGLNYTQAPKSDMFLSDTKNMLSHLVFDCAELYINTSTYFHKAGEASKSGELKLNGAGDKTEYDTTLLTFAESGEVPAGYFKKGDIIQLEDKEWLARDRKGITSGVPIAFTVMEDTDSNVVQVSPGITYGVDVPDRDYLKGAKAKVVPDHCKAFLWWQAASMFKMMPVPAPSTGKYNYTKISAPNAAFGPTRNNSMSFLVESQYVLKEQPREIGELMALIYSHWHNYYAGTLILPPKSPKPETYIKTIKNLSTADKEKPDKDKKDE